MNNSLKKIEFMGDEIIMCVGMSGSQDISRYECGRRYFLARMKAKAFSNTDLDISGMSSLEICSTCLEGKNNMEKYKQTLIDHEQYPNDVSEG